MPPSRRLWTLACCGAAGIAACPLAVGVYSLVELGRLGRQGSYTAWLASMFYGALALGSVLTAIVTFGLVVGAALLGRMIFSRAKKS